MEERERKKEIYMTHSITKSVFLSLIYFLASASHSATGTVYLLDHKLEIPRGEKPFIDINRTVVKVIL